MTQLETPPAHEVTPVARDPRGTLKVGIVSPYGYPHPGGVNDHVRNQYEQLTALGHDAWIITSNTGASGRARGTSSASGPAGRSPPMAASGA